LGREVLVRQFIAALRQLRHPLVVLAIGILVVQTLVAGLASAHAAARAAAFGSKIAVICHSDGADDSSSGTNQPTHDCCTFCTAGDVATVQAGVAVLERIGPHRLARAAAVREIRPLSRAIRAGPSQAPPIA
jgi:hypothetical protein